MIVFRLGDDRSPFKQQTFQSGGDIKNLAVATRIHLGKTSKVPDLENTLKNFRNLVQETMPVGAQFYVAVDVAQPDFFENVKNFLVNDPIIVLPITPWQEFTPALNALHYRAAKDGARYIMYVSPEIVTTRSKIQILLDHMQTDTLVVGAALPGHDYQHHAVRQLNGRTTPWNTLAVWNVAKLGLTGFPVVAEGVHKDKIDGDFVSAGVEEVSAIALLQSVLTENRAKAKLVQLPDIKWEVSFQDEERRKWHDAKMKSKVTRPDKHLELMGLSGRVEHW